MGIPIYADVTQFILDIEAINGKVITIYKEQIDIEQKTEIVWL